MRPRFIWGNIPRLLWPVIALDAVMFVLAVATGRCSTAVLLVSAIVVGAVLIAAFPEKP